MSKGDYANFDFDTLDEDDRKNRLGQVEKFQLYLLKTGHEKMAEKFDLFASGMIREGGATWDEASKTLKIDYRYADGPAYGIQFYDDGEIWIVDPEGNPKRSGAEGGG